MKVLWTHTSLRHLTGIYNHISQDSPEYALRMIDRITDRSKQLASFPNSGGRVPEYRDPHIREVVQKPYRIIYRTHAESIEVLAVIHGASELPPIAENLEQA